MKIMTREAAEIQVRKDYDAVRGRIILVRNLDTLDDNDVQLQLRFDPPLKVRIVATIPDDCIVRWMDGKWIDPIWDVDEVVEPERLPSNVRPTRGWVYGISYNIDDGTTEQSDFVLPDAIAIPRLLEKQS
jgi:hypothetical protein